MASKEPGVFGKVNFTIRINLLLIIIFLNCALFGLYWLVEDVRKDDLKFIATCVGVSAAIYGAYYVAATLSAAQDDKRRDRAFQYMQFLGDFDRVQIRVFIDKHVTNTSTSQEDLLKNILDNDEALAKVRDFLGTLEDMAIAIKHRYVDETVLYQSLGVIVIWYVKRLRAFIEWERKPEGCNTLYIEVQELALSWQSGKYLSTESSVPSEIRPN